MDKKSVHIYNQYQIRKAELWIPFCLQIHADQTSDFGISWSYSLTSSGLSGWQALSTLFPATQSV